MYHHVYWSRLCLKFLVTVEPSFIRPRLTIRSKPERTLCLCLAQILNDSETATNLALKELGIQQPVAA